MDVDPKDLLEEKERREELELKVDRAKLKLNSLVAITIALLATFMGLCKIKDENIVLSMQRTQSNKIDAWNFYQARNIRQEIMAATATQLKFSPGAEADAKKYKSMAADQAAKKGAVQKEAQDAEKTYDLLHERHDQFDLEDAALAIAISLYAITSLTQKKWMYAIASVPAAGGVVMGFAGLMSLNLRPEAIMRLFG